MTEKNAASVDLGSRGRKFWRETVGSFELTRAELEILKEACRVLDRLDELASVITAEGSTTAGSKGQTVIHPALGEARGQQLVLHRLIAALALPDDEGVAVPSPQRIRAQRAAASRWRGHQTDAQKRAALRTTS